jgi:hypothetical protein
VLPTDGVAIPSDIGSGSIEAVHAAVCILVAVRRQFWTIEENEAVFGDGDPGPEPGEVTVDPRDTIFPQRSAVVR